ncbi:IPT/TIG domain-containing protein [Streptomyces platensis]
MPISPDKGPTAGGTQVTITGANLSEASAVSAQNSGRAQ